MQITVASSVLECVRGDITEQTTDAIVNAANSRLAGGGGVDGAIHRTGGPDIMKETAARYPEGCPTGSAVITSAGRLACRWVIHAVGPVWNGGKRGEPEQLSSAYRSSLSLACEHSCGSVSFPSLSTGAYGYPVREAARVAIKTVCRFLEAEGSPQLVRFVLFDDVTFKVYTTQLEGAGFPTA